MGGVRAVFSYALRRAAASVLGWARLAARLSACVFSVSARCSAWEGRRGAAGGRGGGRLLPCSASVCAVSLFLLLTAQLSLSLSLSRSLWRCDEMRPRGAWRRLTRAFCPFVCLFSRLVAAVLLPVAVPASASPPPRASPPAVPLPRLPASARPVLVACAAIAPSGLERGVA